MHPGDIIGRRALYSPDALAVIDTSRTPHARFTYADLDARATRLAIWLRAMHIDKGDRVAMLAYDGVEILDAFFACGKLGAIFTPLNWRLHAQELIGLCRMTTPKILLHSADITAASSISAELDVPTLNIGGNLYQRLVTSTVPAVLAPADVSEEDTACVIFTGGTTGLPKAARISHRMIAWNTLNTVIHDLTHGDITVNVFPMFHTGGLLVYTMPLLILGGTVILMHRFDPANALHLLQQYRATVFAAVPSMYQMMTGAPNWLTADLSSLRFCTSGGAPLPVPLVEKFRDEKGVRFKQGFGMTEFGPGIFALAPDDAIRKAGSIGRPNFYVQARIVDEANRPLPPGEVGELVLKGPSMASGYLGMDDERMTDEHGFFHTGDLARCDDEGYYFIVDRKKDMFISGGENIYPAEVEQALYTHPSVAMCAVVGVPDAKWGEVGAAFVVIKPDADADAVALTNHLRNRLASYKVPRMIEIVGALPMTSAGKVLKRELRERAMARIGRG